MSEGRLAPVRETDRHAALVAGVVAAMCSAATFAVLYGVNVRPDLGDGGDSITTSFPFFTGVAAALGLVAGCAEGVIASRAARRAADRFAPLSVFARKVFVYAAVVNVVLSAVATGIAFSGSDRVIAELCSFVVAIGASAAGAALFGWSHALDWPHVPEYLFAGAPQTRYSQQAPSAEDAEHVVDVDATAAGRDEVINEKRSRRSTANVDDEVWQEIQDLIQGK